MTQSDEKMQILDVRIFDRRFSIDLTYVERILLLMNVEPVPQGPDYLLGIFNYDGDAVPVVDLAVRLGMTREEQYSLDMSVVLCKSDTGTVGLLVDSVQAIREVNRKDLQLNSMFGTRGGPLQGVVEADGYSSMFLDVGIIGDIDFTGKKSDMDHGDLLALTDRGAVAGVIEPPSAV